MNVPDREGSQLLPEGPDVHADVCSRGAGLRLTTDSEHADDVKVTEGGQWVAAPGSLRALALLGHKLVTGAHWHTTLNTD